MEKNLSEFIWAEKYRPSKVDECVLPKNLRAEINELIKDGQVPNLLFSGRAGTGKTSLAYAIASQVNADLLYINASNETGISVVREKIIQFASTVSLEGNLKIILCDEADRFSGSAQDSLKATIEQFSRNTRFILTSNSKNKLIEPLHSRLTLFEFVIPEEERTQLTAMAFKRCVQILREEGITFDMKAVASMVQRFYPDMRKLVNELQRFSASGSIDPGLAMDMSTSYDDLVTALKAKKFVDVRTWIARNSDIDPVILFRYFYDNLLVFFQPKCIPNIVLILAQYQNYSASGIVDQEINSMGCMTEIMGVAEWK